MKQQLGGKVPDKGALVIEVTPGSPAAKVGIQQGDIITALDTTPIAEPEDVVVYVTNRKLGDPVQVTVLRGGQSKTFRAILAEAPSENDAGETPKLGLSLQTLTPALAQSLGLSPDLRGAIITDVTRDSPAARAGLNAGDVIIEIDHKAVPTADAAVSALKTGQRHLLRVRGPLGFRFVTIGG
jgi:serine protease Do